MPGLGPQPLSQSLSGQVLRSTPVSSLQDFFKLFGQPTANLFCQNCIFFSNKKNNLQLQTNEVIVGSYFDSIITSEWFLHILFQQKPAT